MNLSNSKLSQKQMRLWMMTAMLAPLVQTASGCSWVSVLAIGMICFSICLGMDVLQENWRTPAWLAWIRSLWMGVVLITVMQWTHTFWPGAPLSRYYPVILAGAGAWAAAAGEREAAAAGGVMRYGVLFLIGAVLLSGIKDIRFRNLVPRWQIWDASLITVMLIPAASEGWGKTTYRVRSKVKLLLLALAASAIASGVLSLEETALHSAPFYMLSRSAALFDTAKRFESLAASGMSLGFFVLISYLLSVGGSPWLENRKKRQCIIWAVWSFAAVMYLFGLYPDSRYTAIGSITVWILLPALDVIKNNYKKCQKSIDKETDW